MRVEAATTNDGKMSMKHITERSLVELGYPLFKESEDSEAPDVTHMFRDISSLNRIYANRFGARNSGEGLTDKRTGCACSLRDGTRLTT